MSRQRIVLVVAVVMSTVSGCPLYTYPVQYTCHYPLKLKLTSTPNGIVVDGRNCNQEVGKLEFADAPQVAFPQAMPNGLYTLIAVDPDPPNHSFGEYWLHWIVTGIKGSEFANGDISSGNQIISYLSPAPPEFTGAHRYIFLVYQDIKPLQPYEVPTVRPNFVLSNYLQKYYGKLCGPIAGMQFRSPF